MSSPAKPRVRFEGVPLERLRRLRELQEQVARREAAVTSEARAELLERCPHPLALAQHFEPHTVATPAMELLSRAWVETLRTHNGRLVMSTPAQQGKTSLARWSTFWAFLRDPSCRVMYACYGVELAQESGRAVRQLVDNYGAPYGITLDRSHSDVTNWELERVPGQPHAGRMIAISPTSRATGLPSDVMVVDDIYSGEGQAHSEATLRSVEMWWESTARMRMRPGAPAVAIGTRFGERDLLGRFDEQGWRRINVPALDDGETLDSLAGISGARSENGYLISTRGTTEDDWRRFRAEVGERAWAAASQGRPAPLEGGVWQRGWLDSHRVGVEGKPAAPTTEQLSDIAVGVDPAETGTGDEAGIVIVGVGLADSNLYVLGDLSGSYSTAQWARKVCIAWLSYSANRVIQERSLGSRAAIPDAWAILRRQATAILAFGGVEGASQTLAERGDEVAAEQESLREVEPYADRIVDAGAAGPRVVSLVPKQSKLIRAESAAGPFETGKAHMVGRHPRLEHQMLTWDPSGSKSPDRVDALALLVNQLDRSPHGRSRILV